MWNDDKLKQAINCGTRLLLSIDVDRGLPMKGSSALLERFSVCTRKVCAVCTRMVYAVHTTRKFLSSSIDSLLSVLDLVYYC